MTGLVHISEMSEKFVKDPKDIVKVGDIVKVKVIEKDLPSDDVNIFINEIINNSENWYKEKIEN